MNCNFFKCYKQPRCPGELGSCEDKELNRKIKPGVAYCHKFLGFWDIVYGCWVTETDMNSIIYSLWALYGLYKQTILKISGLFHTRHSQGNLIIT